MVSETLNKLKWTGGLAKVEIVFVHRGAKDDRKTISGRNITSIKRSHFYYRGNDRETFIPNHRVLEIRMEGKVIWRKRTVPKG
ncbi:MAG: RNA repair domain-containing protein [Candidatus Aenigmarchaeota archaeon]